jgi:alkanesulfonate monooxygenase SsuD/methylene tetrahydromethanopterin reductase-like flavin-dependent oxidoreductase (luciferase family)
MPNGACGVQRMRSARRSPGDRTSTIPEVRIGIIILPDLRWNQAARRWRSAEELGFTHAWTYDHLGWRDLVDGPWFDAVPTLAAAALVTSRIRLGTMVASPNFRHPVSFARQLTALDDVSDGRLVLGVGAGAGGASFDAAVLGGPPLTARQRADRFAEFAELLDLVLRGDRVTWRGGYYTAVDARSAPGCVQSPRVPFVVAANGPRSMKVAARFGHGWVTTPVPGPTTWRSGGARSRRQLTVRRGTQRSRPRARLGGPVPVAGCRAGLLAVQRRVLRRGRRPGSRSGFYPRQHALAPAGRPVRGR